MKTKIFSDLEIDAVAKLLKAGGIVSIPTDTLLGLAVMSNNLESIHRLRSIKQRPNEKALAYMVDSLEKIEAVCHLNERDYRLISEFLPGPITFIFKKRASLSIVDESGLDTLAIRIPNHQYVIDLISRLECGLYVPSANISSHPPATTYQQVLEIFDGKIEGVVAMNSLNLMASTIIDASGDVLKCLRQGPISLEEIETRLKINE